ncbi:MAG: helix-turn-helix domain-containing protein [Rhodothermales bacterium]
MIHTPRAASAALADLRVSILNALREPNSASGLASVLGLPRQKVNYHVRQLEDEGLVRKVGERPARGFTEVLMQTVARRFMIVPQVLGDVAADRKDMEDQVSSMYLAALAAEVIQDLAELRPKAEQQEKRLATLSLASTVRFKSMEDQHAFADKLTTFVADLIREYHADTGREFKLMAGVYPNPDTTT